jgi:large subunit ribosomal protein L9
MEVILKEDVPKLGHRGDVVKVATGYGRNYLLPNKLAIEASAGNKKVIEQMKAAAVRKAQKDKSDAEALAKQFEGVSVTITRRAGEHDQLFGSVTTSDIAAELEKKGLPWIAASLNSISQSRRLANIACRPGCSAKSARP